MDRKNSQNICIVATVHALLLFLFNTEEDEIKRTFFVFDENMPKGIGRNLVSLYRVKPSRWSNDWISWVHYRKESREIKKRINRYNKIYAQDHRPVSIAFIQDNNYTFIEDAPEICSNFYKSDLGLKRLGERDSIFVKIKRFLWGGLYKKTFAHNNQAVELLLSKYDNASFLVGKKFNVLPINRCQWDSFTMSKQHLILDIYGIAKDFLNELKLQSDNILFLTQPIQECTNVTAEDQFFITKRILEHYDLKKILIKPHPRDSFDYSVFSDCRVMSANIPSEFISFADVKITRVVTMYSTAVYSFIGKVPVDWYGCGCCDKIIDAWGDVPAPEGVTLKDL